MPAYRRSLRPCLAPPTAPRRRGPITLELLRRTAASYLVVQAGLGDEAGGDVSRLRVQRVAARSPAPVGAAHAESTRREVEAEVGTALGAVVDVARARSLDAGRLPGRRDEVDVDRHLEGAP